MKKLLPLLLLMVLHLGFSQNLAGDWKGNLVFQGTTLPTIFHIEKAEDHYQATMDSPHQNAYGIPIDKVEFSNKQLTLTQQAAQLTYEAVLIDKKHLEGTFQQRGFSIPLNLEKLTGEEKETLTSNAHRPQTPKPPYPYQVEEVSFYNPTATITLAGTLTIPKGKGKFPAVVLISGSGPQNRNEEIFEHQPFKVIADYLTRNGIAVLRYDDRGTAASEGDFATATTFDFTDDAKAAVDYLKTRKEINKKKIGAIGHSEGGAIAPILTQKTQLDFIVLMAGPGLQGSKLLNLQRQKQEEIMGINPIMTLQRMHVFQEVYDVILDTTLSKEETKIQTKQVFEKHWGDLISEEQLNQVVEQHNTKWLKTFIRFNPATYLEQVNCEVLAINGEKDSQVPAEENLAAIHRSVEIAGQKVTTKAYPKLNHLFQKAETGSVQEYKEIEQTIDPQVLEDITNWVLNQTKN
ncbi:MULTISPECIES: alpha/beta hydrolase family protein [Mesonia]|uniref:Esterase EstD n=1 Tax=Mesonia oceanica TaxID=2687242 RepID=A0AC61Y7E0_9FLAO|nr:MULTISPECIES: prolyl oligopeptidase family serine peptidase [Mesonia]MAN26063.1 alpha/beta hydrolase [Mesonia sp.]MAQ42196.1 alpha/beta hydrolase [Mesonia sp.]MBJ97936.1 alpha/beta hydrolase [Flavobacteriaceae bacterium]VVV00103.1 Esterase EstD [Mesonia oceanica]|tara:strand:- start:11918 stop:13303 length:1386 start_codon:yes stop_codon:yes gene_type:complete